MCKYLYKALAMGQDAAC